MNAVVPIVAAISGPPVTVSGWEMTGALVPAVAALHALAVLAAIVMLVASSARIRGSVRVPEGEGRPVWPWRKGRMSTIPAEHAAAHLLGG